MDIMISLGVSGVVLGKFLGGHRVNNTSQKSYKYHNQKRKALVDREK